MFVPSASRASPISQGWLGLASTFCFYSATPLWDTLRCGLLTVVVAIPRPTTPNTKLLFVEPQKASVWTPHMPASPTLCFTVGICTHKLTQPFTCFFVKTAFFNKRLFFSAKLTKRFMFFAHLSVISLLKPLKATLTSGYASGRGRVGRRCYPDISCAWRILHNTTSPPSTLV